MDQGARDRTITANFPAKMKLQAKSITADRAAIAVMKKQVLEEKVKINNVALKLKNGADKFLLVKKEAEICL